LAVPLSDADLRDRCLETMRAAGLGSGPSSEAYIRVLVTRGVGDLSYDAAECPTPSVIVIAKPQVELPAEVYERGVTIAIVPIVRNHPGSVNPLIKSNNLLNNALAMQDAVRRGAFEGVMRNYRGELAECTQSNLFVVKDGVALTPPLDAGLLPGITRAYLFEIGTEAGIRMREAVLRDADLFGADEVFLTNTTRGILPATRVDEQAIGAGTPGPITRALGEAYLKKARA
jgi:branched-chain amino acid aminotransferase